MMRALATAVLILSLSSRQAMSDGEKPAEAEQQYRLAQRLGADRSADAPAAFEKVVQLAPHGPLADDALVDLARLQGAPDWPEEVGDLDARRATAVSSSLVRVIEKYDQSDRAPEARYRLALVRTAPWSGRNPAEARRTLLVLAAADRRSHWSIAAHYALGVLDERAGAIDRASGAYARVLLEAPESDVAVRARAGFARTTLASGRFGPAAGRFQEALDAGAPPRLHAEALRDLATREVLRERQPERGWSGVTAKLPAITTARGASLVTTTADGGIVVYDRKNAALQAFDARGVGATPVPAADVTALTTDAFGHVLAAAKDKLVRWDAGGLTVLASLGDFASAAGIASDGEGVIWIADRKGERIGKWSYGQETPVVVRESKGAGARAIVLVGGRLIAAEEKTGRLVAHAADGSESSFGATSFRRPIALCADAALRVSVLDEKAGTLTRLAADGSVAETLALDVAGVAKPLAVAVAPDGAVRILDGATGAVAVAP